MLCRAQTGHFKSVSNLPMFHQDNDIRYTVYKKVGASAKKVVTPKGSVKMLFFKFLFRLATLLKRRFHDSCFSVNCAKRFRAAFLENTCEPLLLYQDLTDT